MTSWNVLDLADLACMASIATCCGLRLLAGVLVMIVLLCLTPVFKNMPQNAQGAVIIAAVVGLFNYEEWWFLLKVRSLPFAK